MINVVHQVFHGRRVIAEAPKRGDHRCVIVECEVCGRRSKALRLTDVRRHGCCVRPKSLTSPRVSQSFSAEEVRAASQLCRAVLSGGDALAILRSKAGSALLGKLVSLEKRLPKSDGGAA